VGYVVGLAYGAAGYTTPRQEQFPFLAERIPLPHHVPEHAGGASFRFAMVQDVLHERFAKHGPTHYRERNRLAREKLAALPADDPVRFALVDDLGVGLDRLGKPDEAIPILRDKLEAQRRKGLAGRDLYTSYANLGTFLVHSSFKDAQAGVQAAKDSFREGIGFIHKSVEVNPQAHFGRERWQAAIAEFLLAAMENPSLIKTFDCLGNRLDLGLEPILHRELHETIYARPTRYDFSPDELERQLPEFFQTKASLDDPAIWPKVSPIREYITKIGAEEGWASVPVTSYKEPVPFDEPVLGIIGMWRQGGGASPHFALALGETMLRVGQRFLAWSAYERAYRLAERFWPDPATQQFLRDHCRRRQAQIEQTLAFRAPASTYRTPWQQISPPHAGDSPTNLRPLFDAELAYGEDFQRQYQQFEESRLASGASIFDEHFFDEFYRGRSPIASRVGPEESFASAPHDKMQAYSEDRRWSFAVLGAGIAAFGTSLLSFAASLLLRRGVGTK